MWGTLFVVVSVFSDGLTLDIRIRPLLFAVDCVADVMAASFTA
jgi:hypothetical protein